MVTPPESNANGNNEYPFDIIYREHIVPHMDLDPCEIFKDNPECKDWLEVGKSLSEFHILNDFMSDGLQYDISPSYHFFQTWITRDMLIIAERNNWNFSNHRRKKMLFSKWKGFLQYRQDF